ncbi:hypothetical protein BKA70DRAFT_1441549 [Coprinopsis sp. MPI-PUGE-AT-0042]|nr:hypothetical protein BKA70DRAFT_1441549 [Coprinopsis sp. MPI-PUGE-AT-0042]
MPSYGGPSSTTSYSPAPAPAPSTVAPTQPPPSTNDASSPTTTTSGIITRVRALHTFEPGELAFDKGDIITVVDRGYKDWWRGQLKGGTGIFPVNYVEPMPEPSKEELWKEAEAEAVVFGEAVHVECLLLMLKNWDVERESLVDNEGIQELYRSCMALRPKIVKLIDKYSQKRADSVSMNEAFVRARSIFDRMMEESLARHTGIYDQQQPVPYPAHARPQSYTAHNQSSSYGPLPVAPAPGGGYGGWNPAQAPGGYDQPPVPPQQQQGYPPYGQQGPPPQQGPAPQAPTPYGAPSQAGARVTPSMPVQPSTYGYTAPYSGQGPTPYPAPGQQQGQQGPYGQQQQGYGAPPEAAQQPPQQPQQQQQQPQLPAYDAPYAPAAQSPAQASPVGPLPDPHANLQHRQSYAQKFGSDRIGNLVLGVPLQIVAVLFIPNQRRITIEAFKASTYQVPWMGAMVELRNGDIPAIEDAGTSIAGLYTAENDS